MTTPNFVYDNLALPADKVDGDGLALPLTNPTRQWGANDGTRVFQALKDLRTVLGDQHANVRSFGAVGDGVADDTAAIQAAIVATVDHPLYFPRGSYRVSSTLFLTNRSNHFIGDFGNRTVDNGTEIVFTGIGPCIQIGVDNGHAWNAGDYNGPQDNLFVNFWISHGAPDTALVSAGDAVLRYKAGAYGIWDWRGGQITMRNVGLEKFEANFVGIESDINTFDVITSLYSKYGIYIGPRSDQFTIRSLYSFSCDRAITVDGARGVRILQPQIVGCGTNTVSAVEIRRGAAQVRIADPWFEHLQGYAGTDQISFVSAGEIDGYGAGGSISAPGGAPNTAPIEGCSITDPLVTTVAAGNAKHTKYIATVGKCKRFLLDHPMPPPGISLGNFDAFVAVPAAQAPASTDTQVLVTGTGADVSASQCFQNLGSGQPANAIWGNNGGLGIAVTQNNAAQTTGLTAVRGRQEGTYTPSGTVESVGVLGQSVSTRSGGGTLRNIGLLAQASGADQNVALKTTTGDVQLNTSSGTTTFTTAVIGTGTRAAAPSTGTHVAGEIVFNGDPIAGGKIGWVCTAGGTPGTWKAFGPIDP